MSNSLLDADALVLVFRDIMTHMEDPDAKAIWHDSLCQYWQSQNYISYEVRLPVKNGQCFDEIVDKFYGRLSDFLMEIPDDKPIHIYAEGFGAWFALLFFKRFDMLARANGFGYHAGKNVRSVLFADPIVDLFKERDVYNTCFSAVGKCKLKYGEWGKLYSRTTGCKRVVPYSFLSSLRDIPVKDGKEQFYFQGIGRDDHLPVAIVFPDFEMDALMSYYGLGDMIPATLVHGSRSGVKQNSGLYPVGRDFMAKTLLTTFISLQGMQLI